MKIRKKLLGLISGLGVLAAVGMFYAFVPAGFASDSYEAQPQWKNLKVLPQDISKDSLMGLMENYSLSLGVKCSYCHISDKNDPTKMDFASDEKFQKEITRGMMIMTMEINEKYFKPYFPDPKPESVTVTNCVTCHRGTANPREYLSNMKKMFELVQPENTKNNK